ncbi:MAG: alpha-ketoglutarate-dependent dioxygenase AlkB [Gemmataceae bacterium]
MNNTLFTRHGLGDGLEIFTGHLPAELVIDGSGFDELWAMHPPDRPVIHLHGRKIAIPRYQQAYGADYHFSGQTSKALPMPALLEPVLGWARETIDERLNGLLLNWYDGALGHYIGAHRDSMKGMCPGCPIVTVSLGEERVFRLRRWRGEGSCDLAATNGSVIVLPYDTNQAYTHEVPRFARNTGRRISVTFRGFGD